MADSQPSIPQTPPEDRSAAMAEARAESEAQMNEVVGAALEQAFGPDEEAEEAHEPDVKHPKMVEEANGDDPEDDPEDALDLDEDEDDEIEKLPDDDTDLENSDEDEEPDEDDEDDLFDLMLALRESGVPASVIKNTSKAKLISWGQRVIAQKASRASSADAATANANAKTDDGDQASRPARASSLDRKAAAQHFADVLGVDAEDAGKALGPLLDAIDSMQGAVSRAEEAARAQEGRATINMQIGRLESKYPQLARNREMAQKVTDEAVTLVSGLRARGLDVDAEEVFNKAARTVLGRPKRSDMKQLRRNGVSHPPTTAHEDLESSDGMTEDEYYDRVQRAAFAGKGQDYIAKIKAPRSVRDRGLGR